MKRSGAAVAAAAAIFLAVLAGTAKLGFAGHPFGTEDAGTQGKGNDGSRTTSLGNGITMGIAQKIDLAVGYAYDFVKDPAGVRSRGMGDYEPFTVSANVGTDIGTHLAGDREVREKLNLVSGLLWEKPTSADASVEWLAGCQFGITDALTLDAGIRWGIEDDAPEVTYLLGFTPAFRGEKAATAPSDDWNRAAR